MKPNRMICYRIWSENDQQYDAPATSEPLEIENGFNYNRLISAGGMFLELGSGINDKNGIQIFEGDIVKWADSNIDSVSPKEAKQIATQIKNALIHFQGRIVWYAKECRFAARQYNGEKCVECYSYFMIPRGIDMEIIGNIHQNPELTNV